MGIDIPLSLLWAIAGICLIVVEIVVPGFVIIFFGFGALVAAFTTYLKLTPTLTGGLVVFSAASLIFLFSLRRFFRKTFQGKEASDGEQQQFDIEIGKTVQVIEDVAPGLGGRVRYHGTEWHAIAEVLILRGEIARVKGRENLSLVLEKIPQQDRQ